MALEAVVFPQDPFSYGCKDNYLYSLIEEKALLANWESSSSPSALQNAKEQWDSHSSPEVEAFPLPPPSTAGRHKRRRAKSAKNKEEIENQRMTHIAVERNRRKQMNEYLAVLRSLMPPSYVQRGDQASIIGGAINFVKELEQLLQSMKGQKKTKEQGQENGFSGSPFAEFFTFPQYSTRATQKQNSQKQNQPRAVADIEVSLVDSHANIKILSKKQPRLLMKMVVGLQSLGFIILHLNVTTGDDMVLTSVSVKAEEGSQLNTVDEIADAVNQLSRTVQEEAAFT